MESSYYEIPPDCDIILKVEIECYDAWESLPFIKVYNREKKLKGFSLYEVFNNKEGKLKLTYK
mgnify:FL=1